MKDCVSPMTWKWDLPGMWWPIAVSAEDQLAMVNMQTPFPRDKSPFKKLIALGWAPFSN